MANTMHGEAKVHIDAPPDAVYALVSDITRMGEWSPECYKAEWVGGATGPAAGAKFKGRNKHGLLRWSTTPEVTAAEPGREFAFKTRDTTWSYRFEAAGGGTEVTESFDVPHYPFFLSVLQPVKKREPNLVANMQATLGRIKAAAEK